MYRKLNEKEIGYIEGFKEALRLAKQKIADALRESDVVTSDYDKQLLMDDIVHKLNELIS